MPNNETIERLWLQIQEKGFSQVKKLLYISVMELNDNERLLTKTLHSNDQPWTDIVNGDRRPNIWWPAVSAMFLFIYYFLKEMAV
jgi:hypothetical protein